MKALLCLLISLLFFIDFIEAQESCYKNATGRGVGVPISTCPEGEQLDAGLCYIQCKANFTGVGPVCWQDCPEGYTDTGAFCQPNSQWGDNSNCPWYDKCGLIEAKGCVICPQGMDASGCLCVTPGSTFAKQSYGRGVGTPMVCQPDQVYDAGLCYPPCDSSQDGVGPVCWSTCVPSISYSCGAICVVNATVCEDTIKELAQTLYQLMTQLVECSLDLTSCNKQQLKEDIEQIIQILDIPFCNSI